jgi:SAM-dependent methyltransferase
MLKWNACVNEILKYNSPKGWDSLVQPHLEDFKIADYGSEHSQEVRFQALLRLPIAAGDRVLDFGCGTGRLHDLLPDSIKYTGLDWSAAIIEEARRRLPVVVFLLGDAGELRPAEWIIASGPFNAARGWSKKRTAEIIGGMCRNAIEESE